MAETLAHGYSSESSLSNEYQYDRSQAVFKIVASLTIGLRTNVASALQRLNLLNRD